MTATIQQPRPRGGSQRTPESVLHVVLSLDCGGLEHVVLQLCRSAAAEGRRAGVVCLEHPGELAPLVERAGAQVFDLKKAPGIDWRLRGRLRRLMADWRPDVVHSHQIGALFYAGPGARRLRLPTVHTEHGKHYDAGAKLRLLARYSAWHCDRYVGVAEDVRSHAVGRGVVGADKSMVITNGIDTQRFASSDGAGVRREWGIDPAALVIGTVGRLEPVKNFRLLVRAFAKVHASLPEAVLLIVGDGSQREPLVHEAEHVGVAGAVRFAGLQSDCAPFYAAMNAFTLTSDSEGLPLSLLEAMAAGTPVAASAVGGIPAVIADSESGLLFPAGDERRAAECLLSLLQDHERAARFAELASSEVHARFSGEAMAASYARLYTQLARA